VKDGQGSTNIHFRRLGTFEVGREDNVTVFEEILNSFDEKAKECGLPYQDDGKGDFEYKITII